MNLFFRVLSVVLAALLAIRMIGCTSPDTTPDSNPSTVIDETIDETINVTDANFTKLVMESELPVVVYFWADWCPPCKWMAPIIEEVASEYKETFLIAKLDADNNRQTVEKYRIEALPTFVAFKNGKMRGRFVGGMQKAALVERIRQAINAEGN